MKLTWLTDIHINFLDENERLQFYQKIIRKKCDAILISGDIAVRVPRKAPAARRVC